MKPKVSFNIPVHSDFRYLGACLLSIASQKFPEFEVILVFDIDNSGMTKEEAARAEKAAAEFNAVFREVREKNTRASDFRVLVVPPCTIGKARQIGVDSASGEIIAFIDSDCVLPSDDWLDKMTDPFEKGGKVVTSRELKDQTLEYREVEAPPEEIDVVWSLGAFHPYDPAIMRYSIISNPFNPDIPPGTGHTLIRKSAIVRAGGFHDINSCEDLDLMRRLSGRIVYMPGCGVYHYYAVTFREYIMKFWKSDKNRIKAGAKGNPHNRTLLLRYRGDRFIRALAGREDPAWLLWPFADFALMVTKVRNRLWS